MPRRWLLAVQSPWFTFGLALLLRLLYLFEASSGPAFSIPFLDEDRYQQLALALNAQAPVTEALFWQSSLYPRWLALIYDLAGPSLLTVKVLQALLDAATGGLSAVLGAQLFGKRVGAIAGIVYALYGPAIFLSAQLLTASWEAFWTVALLLALFHASKTADLDALDPGNGRKAAFAAYAGFGLLGGMAGLAVLTRSLFLPFVASAGVWLVYRLLRRTRQVRTALGLAATLLGGFALTSLPALHERHAVTGEYSLLPISGALNAYIGNSPERCELLRTRGYAWERLVARPFEPSLTAQATPSPRTDTAAAHYFYQQLGEHVRAAPAQVAVGLGFKVTQLFQSLEIPRNVDIYLYREWSLVLSGLTFKLGPFGFPYGVLLPLAIFGAVQRRREIPGVLYLFLLLYCGALVTVFVAGRYRLATIPVLALFAALGTTELAALLRRRFTRSETQAAAPAAKPRPWALGGALALSGGVLSVLPTARCEFGVNYAAEFQQIVATYQLRHGETQLAEQRLREALRLDPDYAEAHYNLGVLEAERGHAEAALAHLQRVLQRYPEHAPALRSAGLIALRLGRDAEAFEWLQGAGRAGAISTNEFAQIGLQLLHERRWQLAERLLVVARLRGSQDARVAAALSEFERQRLGAERLK